MFFNLRVNHNISVIKKTMTSMTTNNHIIPPAIQVQKLTNNGICVMTLIEKIISRNAGIAKQLKKAILNAVFVFFIFFTFFFL